MRNLNRPMQTALETFLVCVNGLDPDETNRAERLPLFAPFVSQWSDEFDHAVTNLLAHQINTIPWSLEFINDMKWLYKQRLVGGPGRTIYDEIRINAEICPYCGVRDVSQLDHYLPKSLYPTITIAPLNLVPSCGDCNLFKMTTRPEQSEDHPFHPYYDQINTSRWLFGTVNAIQPAGVVVTFRAEPPLIWSPLLRTRLAKAFEDSKLGELYSKKFSSLVPPVRKTLFSAFARTQQQGVREELSDLADGNAETFGINSWQAVTFMALAESDWYCSVGYSLI